PTLTDTGQCEWRELKVAVLYPMRNPYKRWYVCHLGTATDFAPLVHGLLSVALSKCRLFHFLYVLAKCLLLLLKICCMILKDKSSFCFLVI
ncbi:MAG: hypothetical protein ACRCYY_18435, partial [Trueperaceae bacterium]